jgi:hypothetical protein
MLRFVARVLIARQHDLCRMGVEVVTTPLIERRFGRTRERDRS